MRKGRASITPFPVFSANGTIILERGYTMYRKGYWKWNFQKGLLQCVKSFQKAAYSCSTHIEESDGILLL